MRMKPLIHRWIGTATLTLAILTASTAWSHGHPLQALSRTVLATLDDIVDYGQECATALGKEVPDFNCVTDGEVLKTTKDGVEITDAAPQTTCDRPALLGYGPLGNRCSPYSRLINKVDGDVVTQIFCRRYQVRPRDDTKFDDVNIIQTNVTTKKTCWFNSNITPQDAAPAPPPYRSTWAVDDPAKARARAFWKIPSRIAEIKCMRCHDSDLWIHTPYVDQATTAHKVPHNPFHKDIENVGSFFAPGEVGWSIPKRIIVQPNYFLKAFPLTDPEKALIGLFGTIASEGRCTQCHAIGQSQTCADFGRQSMWRDPPYPILSGSFSVWSANHWMPTNGAHSFTPSPEIPGKVTSNESYAAYYTRTLKALDQCCADPALARVFPGENGGAPIKICQRARPIGEANLGRPNFTVVVKGNAGGIGIVSMTPTTRSDYDDYPRDGFGGSPWTCPLNGDFFATADGYGRRQVTQLDMDGNIESVTCTESNQYVELDGTIIDGAVNRYKISATPIEGATFTGFADACSGTDDCIQENWYDAVVTANFGGPCSCAPWDGNWSPYTQNPTGAGCTAAPYTKGSTSGYNMWCWAGTEFESQCSAHWRGVCDGCDLGCLQWDDGYVGPDPDCSSSPTCQ